MGILGDIIWCMKDSHNPHNIRFVGFLDVHLPANPVIPHLYHVSVSTRNRLASHTQDYKGHRNGNNAHHLQSVAHGVEQLEVHGDGRFMKACIQCLRDEVRSIAHQWYYLAAIRVNVSCIEDCFVFGKVLYHSWRKEEIHSRRKKPRTCTQKE